MPRQLLKPHVYRAEAMRDHYGIRSRGRQSDFRRRPGTHVSMENPDDNSRGTQRNDCTVRGGQASAPPLPMIGC